MTKRELKKKENALPAEFTDDVVGDAGLGSQDATSDDVLVPYLKLAQAMSEQTKKTKVTYIQDLEEGDFFNSVTEEIFSSDAGFRMIPVLFAKKYLEFIPLDAGGGFKGERPASIVELCEEGDKGELMLPSGNEVVPTSVWYVLVENKQGGWDPCVVSLAKTHTTASRRLMAKLKNLKIPRPNGIGTFNPPTFYTVVTATSSPVSNDRGDWMGWVFSIAGTVFDIDPTGSLYATAKTFMTDVKAGDVKEVQPEGPGGEKSNAAGDPPVDDEVPF